ncbi:unnamed protein product [Calypogeia fissa]
MRESSSGFVKMKKWKEHWFGKCTDLLRGGRALWVTLGVILVLLAVVGGRVEGQTTEDITFRFYETPPPVTSNTTATFVWGVREANGSNPCATDQCVNQCKLDSGPYMNCSTQTVVYTNLADGNHFFTVIVSTARGYFYPNETSWTIDTIPPTAVLDAGPPFTNAVNITVNVKFSEPCIRPGFQCPNTSKCDAYVNGPGTIIPSTFTTVVFGLEYSFTVALSTAVLTGKVSIRMDRNNPPICFDAAGNGFLRNASSVVTVRFGRSIPTLNLWTPAPDQQVQIDNEYKTITATSSPADLVVYLDFSEPIQFTVPLSESLQINQGNLVQTHRGGLKNSKFAFLIFNVSDTAIISVSLPGNSTFNKYGTYVTQTANITFLYDTVPPAVSLSTTSLAKTRDRVIPFLIQFTEPVFVFGPGNVSISGGTWTMFKEVTRSTYTIEVYIFDDDAVTVGVQGNVTQDIAGNANQPSNTLRVKHYNEPAFAVALYSFTTAGLLATALASGALSISSATLAAAGVLASQTSGSISSDPSRNLLGMATHLQVFALSDWLCTSLPVEYRETTRGLRWMIPHVNPPWQKQNNSAILSSPLLQQVADPNEPVLKLVPLERRKLLAPQDYFVNEYSRFGLDFEDWQYRGDRIDFGYTEGPHWRNRRKLGVNMTLYGPALGPTGYATYFQVGSSNSQYLHLFQEGGYTGWRDFARNMFWVGAVGGGLILLHIVLLLFLKWRTKTSVRGALTIPRFEIFLLILAIPAMCQASAFIIRGGTTLGIIIGVLLLAIPAAFLLSVVLFLIIAIFMGQLVQYKEVIVRPSQQSGEVEPRRPSWTSKLVEILVGPKTSARWTRKEGLAPAFLPRYGLFFEDRKGPPKLVVVDADIGGSFPKWTDSGSNGVGRMRAVNSDDESDEITVPLAKRILGGARAAYIAVDISRRIALGVVFGAFARSDKNWTQVSIALGFTAFQLLYLVILKPYIKRGVQVVESISLICETGLFVIAMVLIGIGHPADDHLGLGIALLALLLLSFVSQLVNEWYALMKQLLRLSPAQEPSVKVGMKMLGRGLVLPFIPRRHWGRFISPHQPFGGQQPRTGLVPVVPLSPERAELQDPEMMAQARRSSTSVHTGSPLIALGPAAAIPGYDPGSPAFIDPRNAATDQAVVSGEIKADSSASAAAAASAQRHQHENPNSGNNKSGGNWSSQWNRSWSMEGKRSTRRAKDPKSNEMKMLRDIAKASFPRWRKHEEISDPGLEIEISSPVPSNVGIGCGAAGRKLSSSAPSRVGCGHLGEDEHDGYTDEETNSENSSDDERYQSRRRPPQIVGESSVNDALPGPASVGVTPHSSSSFEKGSRCSGPLETTLSGSSLPVRELIQER